MPGSHAAAAQAFERALVALEVPVVRDPEALGRRAALLVVADRLWTDHLGPLLDGRDVQVMLGVTRQAVSDFLKRRRIFAIPGTGGRLRYPAFQFEGGAVRPGIARILAEFESAEVSAHTLGSWFRTRQRLLRGETPAAWIERGGEPERVVEAARRSSARLGR